MRYFFFLILLAFIYPGCESESIKVDQSDLDLEYYPLGIGNKWEYKYDSIVYDESLGKVDTFSGYLLEELEEEIRENTYIIQRSWRKAPNDSWIMTDRWTVSLDDNRIIKTEENLPFIKLAFPLTKGKSWKGNILFDESIVINVAGETLRPYINWNYEIVSVNDIFSVNGLELEDIIVINQVNDTSLVDLRYSEEKYAPNIGLVEKYIQILDCSCFDVSLDIPWESKAEKGFILKQSLIKFN